MNFNLSIIIPCYNEADNIPFICEELDKIILENTFVQVLLVNNGSRDNSSEVFKSVLENNKFAIHYKLVHVPENKGYGYGILAGLAQADADILAWTHADMQTDPVDIIKAYRVYNQNHNSMLMVKGSRQQRALGPAFLLGEWDL